MSVAKELVFNKTVLITGCSTGIGRVTARLFYNKGWNVVATMRTPQVEREFTQWDPKRALCLYLDVTQPESIHEAMSAAVAQFGRVDVVVNNAGYGLVGVLESLSYEQINRQIQTNITGLIEVSRQAVGQFRKQKSGTLINVASVVGKVAVPLYSIYCATKFAVEGFSEALQFELSCIGAKVKIVAPGSTITDFFSRSADRPDETLIPEEYKTMVSGLNVQMERFSKRGMPAESVAQVIYEAATDPSSKLRYTVGFQNSALLAFRKIAPDGVYRGILKLGEKALAK